MGKCPKQALCTTGVGTCRLVDRLNKSTKHRQGVSRPRGSLGCHKCRLPAERLGQAGRLLAVAPCSFCFCRVFLGRGLYEGVCLPFTCTRDVCRQALHAGGAGCKTISRESWTLGVGDRDGGARRLQGDAHANCVGELAGRTGSKSSWGLGCWCSKRGHGRVTSAGCRGAVLGELLLSRRPILAKANPPSLGRPHRLHSPLRFEPQPNARLARAAPAGRECTAHAATNTHGCRKGTCRVWLRFDVNVLVSFCFFWTNGSSAIHCSSLWERLVHAAWETGETWRGSVVVKHC